VVLLALTAGSCWACSAPAGPPGAAAAVADEGLPSPAGYGDDPTLDRLWDRCRTGRTDACDDLYWSSPVGSRYERFSVGR
jgi:hypothetical protein